jgi:hypothetical protein
LVEENGKKILFGRPRHSCEVAVTRNYKGIGPDLWNSGEGRVAGFWDYGNGPK